MIRYDPVPPSGLCERVQRRNRIIEELPAHGIAVAEPDGGQKFGKMNRLDVACQKCSYERRMKLAPPLIRSRDMRVTNSWGAREILCADAA